MRIPVNECVQRGTFAGGVVHRAQTRHRPGKPGVTCAIGLCALLLLAPAAAQSPAGNVDRGAVENATFTSGIADGAPVDFRQEFNADTPVIYYYTEVVGLRDQTVAHRWKLEGRLMQEVKLPVKSSRQKLWSTNAMQPEWTGNWTVEVVNERGEVINRQSFAYNPPM
jgi:Protein of unknown function (DUF2914)